MDWILRHGPPKWPPEMGGVRKNSRKVMRELAEIALTAHDSWRLVSLPLTIKTAVLTPRGKISGAIEFFAKIWRFFTRDFVPRSDPLSVGQIWRNFQTVII